MANAVGQRQKNDGPEQLTLWSREELLKLRYISSPLRGKGEIPHSEVDGGVRNSDHLAGKVVQDTLPGF